MVAMSAGSSGDERRSSKRIDTHLPVVFSDYRATGPLKTGTAVDRSTGGFRIITAHPEPLGTTIQIELQQDPSKGGGVALFEGRIVHVSRLDSGDYAMGVRLLRTGMKAGPGEALSEPSIAASKPAPVTVPPVSIAGPSLRPAPDEPQVEESVTFRRMKRQLRAGSWGALAAVLVLAVILALLIISAVNEEFGDRARDLLGVQRDARASAPPLRSSVSDRGHAAANAGRAAPHASVAPVDSDFFEAARDVHAALNDSSRISPNDVSDFEKAGPKRAVEGFVRALDYARSAAERGDRGLAMAVLRRALIDSGNVPRVWQRAAETALASLSKNDDTPSPLRMRNAVVLAPESAPRGVLPNAFELEVDRTNHLLRVLRNGLPVAEFPVGLGRANATPSGEFRIANKIADPDWYDRGRVVPAGSPANPLGRQWFGLAASETPTGYGIHPTAFAESIGRDRSRGCIRMRPDDAEALFRLVPVGAPVTIHD